MFPILKDIELLKFFMSWGGKNKVNASVNDSRAFLQYVSIF